MGDVDTRLYGREVRVDSADLLGLAAENVRLRARVDELLARATQMLEERRRLDRHQMVREFFTLVCEGEDVRRRPGAPTNESMGLGLRLVVEEFSELLDAAYGKVPWTAFRTALNIAPDTFDYSASLDLPALADAIVDLAYVLEGLALRCGVDTRPVFALVHAANMTKAGGPVDANGKRGKPPGFVPPDVAAELRRQGWSK